jgi:hypothetical protein
MKYRAYYDSATPKQRAAEVEAMPVELRTFLSSLEPFDWLHIIPIPEERLRVGFPAYGLRIKIGDHEDYEAIDTALLVTQYNRGGMQSVKDFILAETVAHIEGMLSLGVQKKEVA